MKMTKTIIQLLNVNKMQKTIWLIIIGLLILPQQICRADWNQSLGKALVHPGQSIGKISLGLTRSAVLKKIGRPASSSSRRGLTQDTWAYDDPDAQWIDNPFLTVHYSKNKVVQIDIKHEEVFLSDYFSLNNTFAQLRKRFKGLKLIKSSSFAGDESEAHDSFYYDDLKSGMGFFLITPDKHSGKVSPSTVPIYISIHRKGYKMVI